MTEPQAPGNNPQDAGAPQQSPGYQSPAGAQGYPQQGQAYPQQGAGYPPQGQPYPQQPYPPQGYPQQGTPQPPYPPQGYPQQPYPAAGQPGVPGPNPAYAAQPGAFVPGQATPPARKSRFARNLIVRLVIFAIAAIIGVVVWFTTFHVAEAKVGDCLAEVGTDSVKATACDSSDAKYQVVQIFENESEPTTLTNPCNDVAAADSSYWEGKAGSSGRLLCLKDL